VPGNLAAPVHVPSPCADSSLWRPADDPAVVAGTGPGGRVVLPFDPAAPFAVYVAGPVTSEDGPCDWSGGGQCTDGESRITMELDVACA
jgi:hypothetical protein